MTAAASSPEDSGTREATMLRINGKTFRCECGANVFTVDPVMPDWFLCNGCQTTYEGS